MVENKPSQQNKTVSSQINPSALLAAASFATDVVPNGCLYHSWRIALAAERVALELCPEQAGAIFFAGLMQRSGPSAPAITSLAINLSTSKPKTISLKLTPAAALH